MSGRFLTRWLVAVLVVSLLLLASVGFWYYDAQHESLRHQAEAELQAIARLKVDQIVGWRTERSGDAGMITASPFLCDAMLRWLDDPTPELTGDLLLRFHSLEAYDDYCNVMLLDASGAIRLTLHKSANLDEGRMETVEKAWAQRRPVLSDIESGTAELPPHIDVVAPLFVDGATAGAPAGAIVLQADARSFLYPLLQSWPTPSRSAETLLVRRDGDDVLFLNELRHRSDTAFQLRIPVQQANLPAVMAITGATGVVQGRDYRGVEVLAVLLPVPGTTWYMVSKVDAADALADWRERSILLLLVFSVLVVVVVASVVAVWQRLAKAHYRELYESERARIAGEERYQATLLSVGDGVVTTDTEARVTLLNPVAEQLTGWTRAEAAGRPLDEVFRIINEDTRATVESPVQRTLREGAIVGLANHTLLISRDGAERAIADSSAPVRDEEGNLSGVVLVFRDQTAERAAQRTLAESESRYRRLIDSMLDGFALHEMIFDDAGRPVDYRFLSVNPTFERQTGLVRERTVGRTVREVIPDIEERWIETYGRVVLTGEPVHFEDYNLALDRHFEIYAYCPQEGQCACVFRDVSEERRALEEQERLRESLLQAQKMESIGRLAGGVAHDFNNMLSVIINYASFCMEGMEENHPFHADLCEIHKAGERAATLTRQLLAFSRKQVLQLRRVQVNEIITGVEKMLRRLIGEDIRIVTKLAPDLGCVLADPGQIEQVLMNLAVNSRDAMPNGGTFEIETATAELDAIRLVELGAGDCSPGAYVMLRVSDTGVGMEADTRLRVFEPYFTTKGIGKGTGLGLATVYGIVRQSNGCIQVESEPGRGATFRVYLPLVVGAEESGESAPLSARGAAGGETILVAEDEDGIRLLVERMLSNAGYQVLATRNGDEAMERATGHEGPIHLLLTDVIMPRVSGGDLARQISERIPGIRILFMSGYPDDAITRQGVLEPGTHLITKPFGMADLLRKVRGILDA